MITEISIENFRAYSDPITVRLRPITVLIGRNSAGKSTLIKFLQMLRQTIETAEGPFFVTEGRHVHLGAFCDLKNANSRSKRTLKFALRIKTDDAPPPELLKAMNSPKKGKNMRESATSSLSHVKAEADVITYDISGNVHYTRNSPRGRHCAMATLGGKMVLNVESRNLRRGGFLRFPQESDKPEDIFQNFLENHVLSPVRYELLASRHLSAIREESQRAIIVASPPHDDVGHNGEYAMPHLQRLLAEKGDPAELLLRHTEAVAGIRDLRFETAMQGYLGHVKGVNAETDAECHLADFGFGVSQCIPIFVQGALMDKGQLLMVEQPEAHLHPTAQLNIGSFFTDLWRQRGVASLLESHSGNALLRIRNHVKMGDLSPDDVSVAYFHWDEGRVAVRNLDVEKDGSIAEGLPMEFFGADILEAMRMGAGKQCPA